MNKYLLFLSLIIVIYSCQGNADEAARSDTDTTNVIQPASESYEGTDSIPQFFGVIKPIDVSHDTAIVHTNTTNRKVTLLLKNYYRDTLGSFGPQDKRDTTLPRFSFGESLWWGASSCYNRENFLIFSGTVFISDSLTYVMDYSGDHYCHDTLAFREFLDFDYSETPLSFEIGKVIVQNTWMHCMDTSRNNFILKDENGIIIFKDLFNVHLFEYDLDANGEAEIYLISYAVCVGHVAIFKIE